MKKINFTKIIELYNKKAFTEMYNTLEFQAFKNELEIIEKRATARTARPDNIIEALCWADDTIFPVKKKDRDGLKITIDVNENGRFPNKYKYTPQSTQATFIYKKGWYLSDVCRADMEQDNKKVHFYGLNDSAKNSILEYVLKY